MQRLLRRLDVSPGQFEPEILQRLYIPDAAPPSLLEEMDNFAALAVILSHYVAGTPGEPSSHREGHCSAVSGRSSKYYRREREKRPDWCWGRSQNS